MDGSVDQCSEPHETLFSKILRPERCQEIFVDIDLKQVIIDGYVNAPAYFAANLDLSKIQWLHCVDFLRSF
jgi:hypothetical protein